MLRVVAALCEQRKCRTQQYIGSAVKVLCGPLCHASLIYLMQVVTDMQRGGFVYWKRGDQDGRQLVYEKVLVGMDALYQFLRNAINKLPDNLGEDDGPKVVLPDELNDPPRCKLVESPKCTGHASELSLLEGPFFDGTIDDLDDFDLSCTLGRDQ
eukprot:GHUV01028262.1.p1 GENE.GHUV01028262.1~~GHUV01028262.1.p1  ORF type:complete len:155 (+),score=38.92 GHUV01028262.1:325-789(+)